ncbi:hypothetical protein [Actinacidiphila yeochonensis]|uniref:hypothetical protein n=1 Tax=Actinacidiphila yeochonensis TaxID=89050 RepID=UPI000692304C
MNRLAANDPSGRHVCYRAFVKGEGWQPPVCDGTMAGDSQSEPLTALNVAAYGVSGTQINVLVHDPGSADGQGKWEPNWTPVTADGKDLYSGSTTADAPAMSAFGINVGSGQTCQNIRFTGEDWGTQGCQGSRPTSWNFGGTGDNAKTLEAIWITVPAAAQ